MSRTSISALGPLLILAILIGWPLAELAAFGAIGGEIGIGPALLLTIATAVIGLAIVRWQGIGLVHKLRRTVAQEQPVLGDLLEAVLLAIAGIFLFLPGFLTDGLGAVLLIPPLRSALAHLGAGRAISRVVRTRTYRATDGAVVIDSQDYESNPAERK